MITDDHYFDHEADMGIIGRGDSLEASFVDGAIAVFALMGDLSLVRADQSVSIAFAEDDVELAFVTWLNLLIAKAQVHQLIFSHFDLKRQGNAWSGMASGQSWHHGIDRGIEVKGATLTMLEVKKINGLWEARCVVDV